MTGLKGGNALRARLRAVPRALGPIGRTWGRAAVREMRSDTPVRTGRTRRSFKVARANDHHVEIEASTVAIFIDAGTGPHTIAAKTGGTLVFKGKQGTIFARSVHHRGTRARPFIARDGAEALRKGRPINEVVKKWNGAA